jgi:hypothetical protein
MAIDTTPSTVATNALQAIPFSSLIGGPLEACIKAQAAAAKTSYEFIKEVGLTIDPVTGEKKAINVTFQYNNNGKLTTLVVPLIILVPIPYLAINTVDIEFLANISAASSSSSETTSDTELGVDVSADAALVYGPFALKVKAKANYSSKQHSKATSDSRYSVEYTMGVKVSGGQADMPAGLATVLNILQGSVTSVSPDEVMSLSPAFVDFDQIQAATLQVSVKTPQGLVAPGIKVTLEVVEPETGGWKSPFERIELAAGHDESAIQKHIQSASRNTLVERAYRRYYLADERSRFLSAHHKETLLASTMPANLLRDTLTDEGPSIIKTGLTDKNGAVIFKLILKDEVFHGHDDVSGKLLISADVPSPGPENTTLLSKESEDVKYNIIPLGPTSVLKPSLEQLVFANTEPISVTITATSVSGLLAEADITAAVTGGEGLQFKEIVVDPKGNTTPTKITADSITGPAGKATFTFQLAQAPAAEAKGEITFKLANANDLVVKFTAPKPKTP